MIFLSHNYKDKDVVGPIAVSLSGKINNFNCRGIKSMSQDLTPEQPLYFKVKNINQLEINHLQVWIVNGEKATLLKVNN